MTRKRNRGQRAAIVPLPGTAPPPEDARAPRAGGRLSLDNNLQIFGNTPIILPPLDYESGWRTLDLDTNALDRISPTKLIEYLANLSPEVSRAVWDFLRQCNPGHTMVAFRPGTERTPDPRGQAVIDALLARIKAQHGAVDVVIGRLFIAAFLRGAFMAEGVMDEAGREMIDLATPDPATIRFRRFNDPVLGAVWQPGQFQMGGFVPLDRPTIVYLPIDPFPGSPYGRSPAAPGVFPALFLLGLLHDLRRVVAQQGWPRLDISIDLEKLKAAMPLDVQADGAKFRRWVDDTIADVEAVFRDLPPDAAYVHTGPIAVNRPTGAVDSSSLGAVDGIIGALERMIARATKTNPLLMGIPSGGTESQANRVYEAQMQSIRAFQHLCEQLLERLFDLALQAAGVPGTVEVRFAENRASEELRDSQVLGLKLAASATAYDRGWVSQDEAAQMALGRASADQPEPRVSAATSGSALTASMQSQPEPSVNRASTPVTPEMRARGDAPKSVDITEHEGES